MASVPELVEIRVAISRAVLLAMFEQATQEGRSSLDVIRERIERPALLSEKARLDDYSTTSLGVRPRRRDGGLWQWEKFVVSIPLKLKCELMRIARENFVTQNELGLFILRGAVQDQTWLAALLVLAAEAKQENSE
ncbi:hypothetical protein ETAA8_25640 [Anatilimnocola aggregata]|uniref:Uncharacterized protein n=1 Tax=Anatilimnocola aggregata TaxID=2528021 RepID=A0A517YB47_9BACT|nr:hypothetical protein [Anatilimnocola aggregata]QDU27476.1 hypothetical protein ETAA8_25640 [Anatilimnocola aggregata]